MPEDFTAEYECCVLPILDGAHETEPGGFVGIGDSSRV